MIQLDLEFEDTVLDNIQNCPKIYQDLYCGKYIGKPVVKF